MDILKKQLSSFTFNDIVSFCGQREREGVQLEYKRDLTTSSVPKSIAAFSNTRGGVIIIGVEEDRSTGLPNSWVGISDNGQNVDRIHQWASNVDPIPNYEVFMTPPETKNGNVFILIQIFEGDNTPYFVQNDSHLWIRTGNVSTPIDMARPETQVLLYKKREEAKLARQNYLRLAEKIWRSSLAKAERQRLLASRIQSTQGIGTGLPVYSGELGYERARIKTFIQPFYPHSPLGKPSNIKDKLTDIRFESSYNPFPSPHMVSIPEGLLNFEWDKHAGALFCEQIYSTGLVQYIRDISEQMKPGKQSIYMENVLAHTFIVLKASKKFYSLFGYQGNLLGATILESIPDDTEIIDDIELHNSPRNIRTSVKYPVYEDKFLILSCFA